MSGKLLTRHQLAAFLTEEGFPISRSTLNKYCSPAINTGPPVKSYWGRLPLHDPGEALNWAKGRLRPARGNQQSQQSEAAA